MCCLVLYLTAVDHKGSNAIIVPKEVQNGTFGMYTYFPTSLSKVDSVKDLGLISFGSKMVVAKVDLTVEYFIPLRSIVGQKQAEGGF